MFRTSIEAADRFAVESAQRVDFAVTRKAAVVAELACIEVHDRIAGPHQGVRVADIGQEGRGVVVTLHERHALAAVGRHTG